MASCVESVRIPAWGDRGAVRGRCATLGCPGADAGARAEIAAGLGGVGWGDEGAYVLRDEEEGARDEEETDGDQEEADGAQ